MTNHFNTFTTRSTIRQIILFVLSLALALSLVKCKHEPPPEVPKVCQYDSSVEEMKKWYYFKTGTWWVYQEQTTGDLDTITVYYDWEGTNGDGTVGFETWGNSSYDGFNYKYNFNSSFSIHCLAAEECTCHKVKRAKTMPGNFVGEAQIFLYPLIEGNYTASNGGWCTLDTLHTTYELYSTIYLNVAEWNIPVDASENYVQTRYWIAENIGIVRRKNSFLNSDWILIEYNIIQ
jgi:hypothetical protein